MGYAGNSVGKWSFWEKLFGGDAKFPTPVVEHALHAAYLTDSPSYGLGKITIMTYLELESFDFEIQP